MEAAWSFQKFVHNKAQGVTSKKTVTLIFPDMRTSGVTMEESSSFTSYVQYPVHFPWPISEVAKQSIAIYQAIAAAV
jgi:hypothetical protein